MNNSIMLEVIDAGIQDIIVDSGRRGCLNLGLTQGGALDQHGYRWANWLCGNGKPLASIECLLGGMTLLAKQDCMLGIAGAHSLIKVDGEVQSKGWKSLPLRRGQALQVVDQGQGARTYIAIKGGFEVPLCFGSASTISKERLGGLHSNGKPLAKGDQLFRFNHALLASRSAPDLAVRHYHNDLVLRLVAGYQWQTFSSVVKALVVDNQYTVSAQSNRMAAKLEGLVLNVPQQSLYSEGICRGAVQVPPDGLPIIMLNDRQTVGGYPKLGSVLSLDCDKLAQASAGAKINFQWIDIHQAHNALTIYHKTQSRLGESVLHTEGNDEDAIHCNL